MSPWSFYELLRTHLLQLVVESATVYRLIVEPMVEIVMTGDVETNELDDAAFVTDLATRLFRSATPAMGFDQGDTDRLHRIARGLSTSLPCKSGEGADVIARRLLRKEVGDGDKGVSVTWGGNPDVPAHAALRAIEAALSAPDKADIPEAIRQARIEADKVYGIAWHRLEEVSRVELIIAALNARGES
jgi:hypothetical protein